MLSLCHISLSTVVILRHDRLTRSHYSESWSIEDVYRCGGELNSEPRRSRPPNVGDELTNMSDMNEETKRRF